MENGIKNHEYMQVQAKDVIHVLHQLVEQYNTERHVHHINNVVHHQLRRHVLMENGIKNHEHIQQPTKDVIHVLHQLVEQYNTERHVRHTKNVVQHQ